MSLEEKILDKFHIIEYDGAVDADEFTITRNLLALISSEPIRVKCGEQHDRQIRDVWCRKVDENKTGDWQMIKTKEGLYQICQKCSGTGYREVVVVRDIDGNGRISPFTPADLPDVIEGRATLEWKE